MNNFIDMLDKMISEKKKMTSSLYQVIMAGKATHQLLKNFVIHRFPIKNLWTRNILGIASRIDDYSLRCELIRNIYEEETGELSNSRRHLLTFLNFGKCFGVDEIEINNTPLLDETKLLMEHNTKACNSDIHFTAGVASVLLLMEGQPPIFSENNESMEKIMRDIYELPVSGYEFFTHHASNINGSVSELEDEHASTARNILNKYCVTEELRNQVITFLQNAITLRHKHFDSIYNKFYVFNEQPFRFSKLKIQSNGVSA